jgi:pyruvate formate lyase activating enzyme
MQEANLYEKLPDSFVRCHTCQWFCRIAPDKNGVCRMYTNRDGLLFNLNYGKASSLAVDPIEKKPLFHFYPGSLCFSLGSWGCNFHCSGCQNWEIACVNTPGAERGTRNVSPNTAINLARGYKCQGIAWTYNEPTVWFEYTLDTAKLAREAGLYTVYVTNGYITPEALDIIGPYLTAWRVDIKGFTDATYKTIARISHWRGILEVAKRAKEKWGMHVEVVTNLIPGLSDDNTQLSGIANWIACDLGEMTPWHVTRFYPDREMLEYSPTPVASIERALDIGHKAGLKFVYAGNVPGHNAENTLCYNCHNLIVKRVGYAEEVLGLTGSKCRFCGAELNFIAGKEADA